jgi:pyridoxal 5'-phosphate synthase pdxT subunit
LLYTVYHRGTCAGMILLSDHAVKQREGGQSLIGGLDVQICRNYFGSQVQSCELLLDECADKYKELYPCNAVFIRAPAILSAASSVEVIATVKACPHISVRKEVYSVLHPEETAPEGKTDALTVIVAVRQGNILATAFHPELTADTRWHK